MRFIIRVLLSLCVIAVLGFLLLGYWTGASWPADRRGTAPIGTNGATDTEKARERGAELGEKAAVASEKIRDTVNEATVTAKIKAKMALDDSVKALAIDVTTSGSTVTLRGNVRSAGERERAVALARDTNGVARVVDQLHVVR